MLRRWTSIVCLNREAAVIKIATLDVSTVNYSYKEHQVNVPHFHHENIFFGLLKYGENKFRAKILVFDFMAVFGQNLAIFRQKCPFWPFSPKRCFNFF